MPNPPAASAAPTRPVRRSVTLDVIRTEEVAEEIVRVWLGGPGFTDFADNGSTEQYVKLLLPPPGVEYEPDEDVETIRAVRPAEEHPKVRTYTVRHVDHEARELAIDFILHGDAGIAAPWAAAARPGDRIRFLGPGGRWSPDPRADWHLVLGDDAALPAIDAALRTLPDDAHVVGIVELAVPGRRSYLDDRFLDSIRILQPGESDLLGAVRELPLPDGEGEGFVHGELGTIRDLRRDLLGRGFTTDRLSISGYWRTGRDEDGFQAEKRAEAERERATTA